MTGLNAFMIATVQWFSAFAFTRKTLDSAFLHLLCLATVANFHLRLLTRRTGPFMTVKSAFMLFAVQVFVAGRSTSESYIRVTAFNL